MQKVSPRIFLMNMRRNFLPQFVVACENSCPSSHQGRERSSLLAAGFFFIKGSLGRAFSHRERQGSMAEWRRRRAAECLVPFSFRLNSLSLYSLLKFREKNRLPAVWERRRTAFSQAKFIEICMETTCWSSSVMGSNMAAGN